MAEAAGTSMLIAQQPLLDRGEGKSLSDTTTVATDDGRGTNLLGLKPPRLCSTSGEVTGADTPQHRIKNKCRRKAQLAAQTHKTQWTVYKGEFNLPQPLASLGALRQNVPIWLGPSSFGSYPTQGMGNVQVPNLHRSAVDYGANAGGNRLRSSPVGSL